MIREGNIVGLRYNIKSHDDDFQMFDILLDPQQQYDLSKTKSLIHLQKEFKNKVIRMRRVDSKAPRPYDSIPIPALQLNKVQNGLKWNAFNSNTEWIPNTKVLTPTERGMSRGLKLLMHNKSAFNVITFEGYINIPIDGEYTFYLKNDGQSFLRIHDAVLIDADFKSKLESETVSTIYLKAGYHPIKLFHKAKSKANIEVKLFWASKHFIKELMPDKAFFHAQ